MPSNHAALGSVDFSRGSAPLCACLTKHQIRRIPRLTFPHSSDRTFHLPANICQDISTMVVLIGNVPNPMSCCCLLSMSPSHFKCKGNGREGWSSRDQFAPRIAACLCRGWGAEMLEMK